VRTGRSVDALSSLIYACGGSFGAASWSAMSFRHKSRA
jgi:hypothetical protein